MVPGVGASPSERSLTMAHPHADIRQSKVERSRVASITKGYATGGAVTAAPVAAKPGAKAAKPKFAVGGAVSPSRQDRPNRARGGRTKSKGTNVNVIIGSPASAAPPPGVAGPMPAPPPMPPRPMMAPPPGPGGPPMAGPGGPPPGMPIRSSGGRAYASGGAVKPGAAFEEGKRLGTKVQHSPNKMDGKDIGRGRVITYKTGGAVFAKPTGQHGPKYDGGGGGGKARLEKAHRAAKNYKKA